MKTVKTATATMALGGSLLAGVVAASPSEAAPIQKTAGARALPFVTVTPDPEYIADPIRIDPFDWVNNCTPGRFCAYQADSASQDRYLGFQFYKCREYALSNWGIYGSNFRAVFNNQNVTVKYLNERHAVIDSTPPYQRDVVGWKAVWYISLCN
ncbi:hypothetical protein ACQPZP_12830 [Spirillospora sp. CA-142024]|uniref:hypothetical protein n=1 Tax=Spirillospora sp. CA-142024 TaxID=3240036 RepID=UPI003D8B5441